MLVFLNGGKMAILFPSDEWIQTMMMELNQSDAYLAAAKNWEGDIYFIIEPGGSLKENTILYMDLFHGKCRDAYLVNSNNDRPKPVFEISAPIANWKKVMTKKLDPMQAIMTGQLKIRGNMAIIMRNVRAAKELVESCTRIDTIFPI
jgi:putative sterol carrier protein